MRSKWLMAGVVGVVALATVALAGFLGRRDTATGLGHALFRKRIN